MPPLGGVVGSNSPADEVVGQGESVRALEWYDKINLTRGFRTDCLYRQDEGVWALAKLTEPNR